MILYYIFSPLIDGLVRRGEPVGRRDGDLVLHPAPVLDQPPGHPSLGPQPPRAGLQH